MALRRSRGVDLSLPKNDRGFGSFNDFRYNLVPANGRVTITLAASDQYQDELRSLVESGEQEFETAISPRSQSDEGVDAKMPVRLFAGRRVSGVVGEIPRGLESAIDENLRRLDGRGDKVRIPVRIDTTRSGYRVVLLIGKVR